jgi:hypothetical protein
MASVPSAASLAHGGEALEGGVESAMASPSRVQLAEDDFAGDGRLDEGSQHVQAHDVSRTLPDGIDGHFAGHSCQRKLFGVAIAAQHFHGLGGQFAAALAHPEFCRGCERTAQRDLAG